MTRADGPFVAVDVEATSVEATTARLVSASLMRADVAGGVVACNRLINPGVPIPEGATAVHAIADAMVADAMPEHDAIVDIVAGLRAVWDAGLAICVYNVPYDMTVVEHAPARHGHATLTQQGIGPVIDPLVIDRTLDRYRAGKRTLSADARTYVVELGDAHKAQYDALATARMAWKLARDHPALTSLSLEQLQRLQHLGHAAWARHYEQYRRRELGEKDYKCDGSCPNVAACTIFPTSADANRS